MNAALDTSLAGELERRFTDRAYAPPMLPATAIEALELSRQREVDVRRLRTLLDREPFLAARLLQVARSPAFNGVSGVNTIGEAVSRLGTRMVSEILVMETMRSKLFRASGYAELMTQVMRHSTAVGYLMRVVCQRGALPTTGVFLIGLLHDAGLAAGLGIFGEQRPNARPPADAAVPMVLSAHELGSRRIATAWELPAEVAEIVGQHHGVLAPDAAWQLHALRIAENLAGAAGADGLERAEDVEPSLAAVGLDSEAMDSLVATARRLVADLVSSSA